MLKSLEDTILTLAMTLVVAPCARAQQRTVAPTLRSALAPACRGVVSVGPWPACADLKVSATTAAGTGSGLAARPGGTRETVAALAAIRHEGGEGYLPYDVPKGAQPLLTQLKHQLRDLILSTLNSRRNQSMPPEELTAEVLKELARKHIPVGENELPKTQEYGGILALKIARPASNPELLVATDNLQVPCCPGSGGDTSLYVMKREAPGWKVVLAVESNDYPQVDGALDSFQYLISAPDQKGDWYVVVAHSPGWCTSCWSGVHYQVLRPGPTPSTPRVLLDRGEGVYRCGEPAYKLSPEPAGFRIDFLAGEYLDFDLFTTILAARFIVLGADVTRMAPVAYSPEDFLNAWIDMPWNEARRWSNPAQASSLERWHTRLQPSEEKGYLGMSKIDFVQSCDSPPTRWQIGLTADRDNAKSPHLFFAVAKHRDAFSLESISEYRLPGCRGETAPAKSFDWEQLEQLRVR